MLLISKSTLLFRPQSLPQLVFLQSKVMPEVINQRRPFCRIDILAFQYKILVYVHT